jgi:adenylate cyclase
MTSPPSVFDRLGERGVIRVAVSYAVIAWLLLQIADVVLAPLGAPAWVMTALIIATVAGFPIAIALAWFLEIGERGVELDTAAAGIARPTVRGLRHYADVIVIGVLLTTVIVLLVRQSDLGKPKPPENPAIAVLPFRNVSGDPEQEYFADGLAQEVLDRLGRVPGLTVIARSSSFSFKGKDVDIRTIAERLGVTTLLEGSVRRDGQRLRLSAQLVDGSSGREIWSGTFDRNLTDVFRVQDELAIAVSEAIIPAVRGELQTEPVTPMSDLNAYDLYLLGRQAQEARTGERLRDSVAYLERAIATDPNYAKAHAALSRSLVLWSINPQIPAPDDAMQRAEAEAHAALAIDPDSAEGHASLGTVLRQRNEPRAEAEYQRALELNPNDAAALWDYGGLLSLDPARQEEAEQLRRRLERIDPRSGILWSQKLHDAAALNDGGRTFRSEFDAALSTFKDDPDGLNLMGRVARSNGYATEAYRSALAMPPHSTAAVVAMILPWMLVDDLDRARQIADEAMRRGADPQYILRMQSMLAGLAGDFSAWEELDRQRRETIPDDRAMRRSAAFWLAVQQRYDEAAIVLNEGEPLPEWLTGPLGSSLLTGGQLLPAVLRIYRATGRPDEADEMAHRYLGKLRDDARRDAYESVQLDLAALAANEGLKDEAVGALQKEFGRYHLVMLFSPRLPWFRSLDGYAPYERILAERKRRVDEDHAQMVKLEAEYLDSNRAK